MESVSITYGKLRRHVVTLTSFQGCGYYLHYTHMTERNLDGNGVTESSVSGLMLTGRFFTSKSLLFVDLE